MKTTTTERGSFALRLAAASTSAATMVWLLWHFPITTVAVALIVLWGVVLIVRVAKTLDTEPADDAGHPNPSS